MKPVRVGLVGEFQEGKSLLVNCLLGGDYAVVGDLLSTTPFETEYHWAEHEHVRLHSASDGRELHFNSVAAFLSHLRAELGTEHGKQRSRHYAGAQVGLPLPPLRQITLVDTPGLDAPEIGERPTAGTDTEKAMKAIEKLDFALVVFPNTKAIKLSPAARLPKELHSRHIPFVVLLNCKDPDLDRWSPDAQGNDAIAGSIHRLAKECGCRPIRVSSNYTTSEDLLRINPAWFQVVEGEVGAEGEAGQWAARLDNLFERSPRPSDNEIRQLSRIPELRRFVLPEPEQSVGVNAFCLGTLHRAAEQWSQAAVQQIQQLKNAVAG